MNHTGDSTPGDELVPGRKLNLSEAEASGGLLGGGVLDLVTTGMYGDPCAMYREYLQNAPDAVDFGDARLARVDICINVGKRYVRIRDNGRGLSTSEAVDQLVPVAKSRKRRGIEIGFRGVGRLAGLVFAESVSFLTRRTGRENVTRLAWYGPVPRELTRNWPTKVGS